MPRGFRVQALLASGSVLGWLRDTLVCPSGPPSLRRTSMPSAIGSNGTFTVRAHAGDAKTFLGFDLPKARAKRLAGFTIQCKPGDQTPYYLYNKLQFKSPKSHAQVASEPSYSSVNAPIHKFRWVHI